MVTIKNNVPEDNKNENSNQNNQVPDYLYIYELLKKHPNSEVRDAIKQLKQNQAYKRKQALVSKIWYCFASDPKDYYGRVKATKKVKTEAKLTARAVTISNLLDFFSNYPIVFFAFSKLGGFPSIFVSFAINYTILQYGNCSAEAVSRSHNTSRVWAKQGLGALICLNIIQSLVSGIGVELTMNQAVLKQILATQQIEEQFEEHRTLIATRDPNVLLANSLEYQQAVERCQIADADIAKFASGDPRRNTAYLNAYGEYKYKDKNWSIVSEEELPVCRKKARLEFDAKQSYKQTKDDLEYKENIRLEVGNDLLFLEKEFFNIYQQEFTPDGEIAAGVTAVALASENFFGKVANLEFASLGLSLFFFSLSVSTSFWSIRKTVKFSQRKDVGDSFDSDLELKRDLWFEKLKRDAMEDQNYDS